MELYNKSFYFIAEHGRGWSFSTTDFMHKYKRQEVDSILSELQNQERLDEFQGLL